jgi:hypothetical protein
VRISQRVGHKHPRRRRWRGACKIDNFREYSQLRNGERPELHFESDEPLHGCIDRASYRAFPFVCLNGLGNLPENAEHESAGAGCGIGQCHRRRQLSPACSPKRDVLNASSTSPTIAPTTSGGV